ncbi:MAG: DUF3050 domain-containing protein [Rhodospirillales bacterium]|nr:DUF3050 domain-containing protein [Rhodospirillales bacterium]
MPSVPLEVLKPYQDRLNDHPLYGAVKTTSDLKLFMEHHVFSVWDFMSLVKFLQAGLAPVRVPWAPVGDPRARRLINEITLEEESDQGLSEGDGENGHLSHYELYTLAMEEVGASPRAIRGFVTLALEEGMDAAFERGGAPKAAADFTRKTFDFIASGKLHVVAAAFALGREHIIPDMFRSLLERMNINEETAPALHFYLNRHIHLDEAFHGPLSLQMVEFLTEDDETKLEEAVAAAISAIEARISFWDGVKDAL